MKNAKKVLALLLALSMVMSYLPMPALAEEASCPHHFHDNQCGYVEKVEGSPCGHVVCSETCLTKQVVECIHDHEEAGCVYTPAVEAADCDHVHGDCNYVAPQDEVVCICDPQTVHGEDCASVLTEGVDCSCVPNVVHAEGCVPQPAVEEYCGHTHGNCAFREAADEKWSCGHVCSEASGCIRMECAHVCPGTTAAMWQRWKAATALMSVKNAILL